MKTKSPNLTIGTLALQDGLKFVEHSETHRLSVCSQRSWSKRFDEGDNLGESP